MQPPPVLRLRIAAVDVQSERKLRLPIGAYHLGEGNANTLANS